MPDDDYGRTLPIVWPKDKGAALALIGRSLLQAGAAVLALAFSGKKPESETGGK